MDSNTPSDSKWLPRIGDWICAGCSNNNYASRLKCNKCGEPKEVAALPAMSGAAPAVNHGMAKPTGSLNMGLTMPLVSSRPLGLDWPYNSSLGGGMADNGNWRPGDWLCKCGYHNYSSRSMCKQCQAPMPPGVSMPVGPPPLMQPSVYPGLGMKRLAPYDFGDDFISKRLNFGGDPSGLFQGQPTSYGASSYGASGYGASGYGASGYGASLAMAGMGSLPTSNWPMQPPPQPAGMASVPAILGKGAKQWRTGDWMCAGCNNHNYSSRAVCNRCGGQKETMAQPLPVA